jgi:hypothetical protein
MQRFGAPRASYSTGKLQQSRKKEYIFVMGQKCWFAKHTKNAAAASI